MPKRKVYYTVAVVYKGMPGDKDDRIQDALEGTGVEFDGGGYFFPTGERDQIFFSKGDLTVKQISNIRRILRNIRRWKDVIVAQIERCDD
jgi:hypothetical protein